MFLKKRIPVLLITVLLLVTSCASSSNKHKIKASEFKTRRPIYANQKVLSTVAKANTMQHNAEGVDSSTVPQNESATLSQKKLNIYSKNNDSQDPAQTK